MQAYVKEENYCETWIQQMGNTANGNRKQYNYNTVANWKLTIQRLFSDPHIKIEVFTNKLDYALHTNLLPPPSHSPHVQETKVNLTLLLGSGAHL